MTKTEKAKMNFITSVQDQTGITPDRWGNFKFEVKHKNEVRTYRLNIKKQVWRFETKAAGTWMKLTGGKFTPSDVEYITNRINKTKG